MQNIKILKYLYWQIEEASRTLIFLTFHEWKEDSKSLPPVESLVKFVNYFRKRHTWDGHPIVVLCR